MSDEEGLGPLYRAAITATPTTGPVDPAATQEAAYQRRHRRRSAAGGVLAAVVLAALIAIVPGLPDGSTIPAVPQAPATNAQPEPVMIVEPATAPAGSDITLRFPTDFRRGVAFQLETRRASGWQLEYYLVAGFGGRQPQRPWWHVDDPDTDGEGWYDIAIGGLGGEQLRVPDDAEPGSYRLCTANARPAACTLLTIR